MAKERLDMEMSKVKLGIFIPKEGENQGKEIEFLYYDLGQGRKKNFSFEFCKELESEYRLFIDGIELKPIASKNKNATNKEKSLYTALWTAYRKANQKSAPASIFQDVVGLKNVKNQIDKLESLIQVRNLRKEKGLKNPTMNYHLVFTGNPGTGKTTIARKLGVLYKKLGILSSGHVVEVDRSDLVAKYLGQTPKLTKEKLESALGGIFFIDEAYTLFKNNGYDYGQEAIDTILKFMEDNRENIVIIVAGYPKEMEKFINSNPGFKSRFNRYIHFDDYSAEELLEMFENLCKKYSYTINSKIRKFLLNQFSFLKIKENFANAREVRNIFEKALENHSLRIAKEEKLESLDLLLLSEVDFNF